MMRTPSQTVGPFYSIGLCRRPDNVLAEDGLELTGQLLDGQETPIADGMIEIWDGRNWGRSGTDAEGRFAFRVPADADDFWVYVFARGLLRHQLTKLSLRDGLRFDIRMQGERATVFFEH
jgi:protocatechuate 3,4-dioxygenase alpha subunit